MESLLSRDSTRSWEELAKDAAAFPTQDAPWAIAAAEALPGEPTFITIGERCDGLAPLVDCGAALEFAGGWHLGEPCDLIARTPEAMSELLERILATRRPLLLQRVPIDSPTIGALRLLGGSAGWTRVTPDAGYPTITLADEWAEPGGGLSSSRRSGLRRSRRHAEAQGEVVAELLCPTPEQVDGVLDEAFAIEARSWKGEQGTAVSQVARTEQFFRRYAHELARRGKLRVDILRIGGRGVAMQLGARWRDAHWLFKIGYDAAYHSGSPGQLLLAESIAAAARDKLAAYQLLGSRAGWTDVWTKDVNDSATVTVLPRSGRAVVAYGSIRWRGAERKLRREARRAKVGFVGVAGRHYVAGAELDDALTAEARYASAGYLTTVGFWNRRDDSPGRVAEEAKASAERLREGSEVSIKLAPMGGDGPLLDELTALCAQRGVTLHLDALQPEGADETKATALRLSERWPGLVGCTLPARWARSHHDAMELAEAGLRIRIVKGEIADAGRTELEPREGFTTLVEALAGGNCHVEVATHDAPLAKQALSTLGEAGTSCELQVLYAMHSAAAIRCAGRLRVPVRVYVPYGKGRIPYTRDALTHNPTLALSATRDVLPLPARQPAIWTAYLLPFFNQLPF